ncbi:MAG: hypothetical protein P8Y42_14370 [Exilibacterium sp.]
MDSPIWLNTITPEQLNEASKGTITDHLGIAFTEISGRNPGQYRRHAATGYP